MSSCYYIDDHPSDCATTYGIEYRLQTVSNITKQVDDQLPGDSNAIVRDYLIKRFTEKTHPASSDVGLYFFPQEDDTPTSFHRTIEGDAATFSLQLRGQSYRHLAVTGASRTVALVDTTSASLLKFQQVAGDTIDGYALPVFSGRLDMAIKETDNDNGNGYVVNLYPADANVAVLVTRQGMFKDVKVYLMDLANGYNINDSTYTFTANPLVRTEVQAVPETNITAYTATVFPSRDSAPGTIDPDVQAAAGAVWRVIVMATLPDNTVTRSVLYVRKPLKAGDQCVIRLVITSNGAIEVRSTDVGASVTLDWKKGGEYRPEI